MQLAEFLNQNRGLNEKDFVSAFDHGFLLVSSTEASEGDAHRVFETKLAIDQRELFGELGEQELLPLVKKGGAKSYTMITVGRTSRNDITIENEAISKFHAYFKRDRFGRYSLCDPGSTNGTKVGGKALEKDEPVSLKGGEKVVFGTTVTATFHTAETLYRALGLIRRWV